MAVDVAVTGVDAFLAKLGVMREKDADEQRARLGVRATELNLIVRLRTPYSPVRCNETHADFASIETLPVWPGLPESRNR
jgi:hypothetical protein